jgi:hypothetical protein
LTNFHFNVTVYFQNYTVLDRLGIKRMSQVIILICWGIGIVSAILSPIQAPPNMESIHIPTSMDIMLLIMPISFFSAVTYFGPAQSPFYHPRLASFLNSKYGIHTYESFLARLKPILLFGVGAILQGLTTFWQSSTPYFVSGFLVSAGLALIAAHIILYHRKAIGVYPSDTGVRSLSDQSPPNPPPTKQPLRVALRLYWWCLIGVFLLPTIMVVGEEILKLPSETFVPLFFVVMFLSFWPVLSQRATSAFWLVAMGLWIGGGFLAVGIMIIIRKCS